MATFPSMSITGEVFTGDLHAISASFCGDKRLPHKLSLEFDWRWEIFNRAESLYRGRFDICSSRLSFRTTLSIIGSELWGDVHILGEIIAFINSKCQSGALWVFLILHVL